MTEAPPLGVAVHTGVAPSSICSVPVGAGPIAGLENWTLKERLLPGAYAMFVGTTGTKETAGVACCTTRRLKDTELLGPRKAKFASPEYETVIECMPSAREPAVNRPSPPETPT
jgi:hypothetical protein